MISHKCRLISWLILAPRPPMHFLHKTFPGTSERSLTVPSFTALAVLFPDYQNRTYVKQQKEALPKFEFRKTPCCVTIRTSLSTSLSSRNLNTLSALKVKLTLSASLSFYFLDEHRQCVCKKLIEPLLQLFYL